MISTVRQRAVGGVLCNIAEPSSAEQQGGSVDIAWISFTALEILAAPLQQFLRKTIVAR